MILPVTNFTFPKEHIRIYTNSRCPIHINLQIAQITQATQLQDLLHRTTLFFFLGEWTIQELSEPLDLYTRLLNHLLILQKKNVLSIFQAPIPVAQHMFPIGSVQKIFAKKVYKSLTVNVKRSYVSVYVRCFQRTP